MNKTKKQSILQYRNINNVKFQCYCSDPGEFDKIKSECKKAGLKYRIISGQIYTELKNKS